MHETRNVLYQLKKSAVKRSSPNFEPDPERDDLRAELAKLRTQLRNKDTELMRLHNQIEDLQQRIKLFEANSKLSSQSSEHLQAFSQIPMMMELIEIRKQNQSLHSENLFLNGARNELEAELRASRGEFARQATRLKELQVLQRMREQRFKDEVARLTPIIVEDNRDFSYLKEGLIKTASFLRQQSFTVAFQLFLRCAKECEREKKVSSFSIFKNCWGELRAASTLGYQAALRSYDAVRKLTATLEEDFCLVTEGPRDTMNQWVLDTLVQIKHSGHPKEREQKLFRLLGLYYRSKFPIKGEKFELDEDVRAHFEDLTCRQAALQLQPQ